MLDLTSWPSSWHFYILQILQHTWKFTSMTNPIDLDRLLTWVKLRVNIGLCRLRNSLSEPCPPRLLPRPMNSSGVHSYTNQQTREPRDINWPGARARMSFFQSEVLKSGLLVSFLITVLHSVKFLPGLPKRQLHFKTSIWSCDKCKIVGLSVMKCFVIHSHEKCSWF